MFKPIKFPSGPSAPGAAGVRALDAVGGDWQRKDGPGYSARIMGGFRRVITGGFEYVTFGQTSPTAVGSRTCINFRLPFIPAATEAPTLNTGRGVYVNIRAGNNVNSTALYVYPLSGGIAPVYESARRLRAVEVSYGSFYGGGDIRGVFEFSDTNAFAYGGLFSFSPTAVFVGDTSGPDKVTLMPTLSLGARTDRAGRVLEDLSILNWTQRAAPVAFSIPASAFTRSDAEFIALMKPVATQDRAAFFMCEKFFYVETVVPGKDYRPKLWMFLSTGKNLSLFNAYNLTATLAANIYVPPPQTGTAAGDIYAPLQSVAPNERNASMMGLMKVVALPGNIVLLAFPMFGIRPGFAITDPDPARWYWRVARIDLTALTGTLVENEEIPLTGPPLYPARYMQDMVHLGDGVVLGREVIGFSGIDFPVKFRRSTDSGATWTQFDPAGFSAPLVNQNFGDFVVHRARSGSDLGLVLINAWDATEQAVYVYSSADSGTSWTRRGRVAKPTTFYRIDSMIAGDGGANFRDLIPGPDPLRLPDLTMPDRYAP